MEPIQYVKEEKQNYHGIIVNASLRNQNILREFTVLSTKKDEDWMIYKVEVHSEHIGNVLNIIQTALKPKFYAHFYRGEELIVIFADAIFKTTTNPKDWAKIIKHGNKQDIPSEQIDFKPCKESDETW